MHPKARRGAATKQGLGQTDRFRPHPRRRERMRLECPGRSAQPVFDGIHACTELPPTGDTPERDVGRPAAYGAKDLLTDPLVGAAQIGGDDEEGGSVRISCDQPVQVERPGPQDLQRTLITVIGDQNIDVPAGHLQVEQPATGRGNNIRDARSHDVHFVLATLARPGSCPVGDIQHWSRWAGDIQHWSRWAGDIQHWSRWAGDIQHWSRWAGDIQLRVRDRHRIVPLCARLHVEAAISYGFRMARVTKQRDTFVSICKAQIRRSTQRAAAYAKWCEGNSPMSLVAARGPLGPDPGGWFSAPLPDGLVYVEPHPRRVQAIREGRTVLDTERALLVHRRNRPLTYAFPADEVGGLPVEPEPEAPGFVVVPWDAVDTWLEEGRELVHYPPNPYHRVDCRPTRRHLRVEVAGLVLVDTEDTVIVFETALEPRLYVNPALLGTDLLRLTPTSTYCNYKGVATYWAAVVGDMIVEDVAWSYQDPLPESLPIKGYLSFDATRADVRAELPGRP
jgi:uncharacterized protein (DUF427 family)